MVAPGVWVDEEPRTASSKVNHRAAAVVGEMLPTLTHGESNPVTSAEYRRRQKRLAATREGKS